MFTLQDSCKKSTSLGSSQVTEQGIIGTPKSEKMPKNMKILQESVLTAQRRLTFFKTNAIQCRKIWAQSVEIVDFGEQHFPSCSPWRTPKMNFVFKKNGPQWPMETVQKFGALDAKKQVIFHVKKYNSHLQTKVVCCVSASILIVFNRRAPRNGNRSNIH